MSKKKEPRLRLTNTTVNTGFSTATYRPKTGKSTYTLSAPLQAMRDQFYGAANEALPTQESQEFASGLNDYGQGLFGYGQDLMSAAQTRQDPLQYYNQQQALLAPNRAVEEARLADTLFKSGRTGAAVGYGDGGYLNPEQFAMLKAREEANAGMMLGAEDRVRALQNQDIAQATGIQSLGLGYQDSANTLAMRPYQNASTLFGIGTGIEGLGQQDLQFALSQANQQMGVDNAVQANRAARAQNSGFSGFMNGAGGVLLNAGLNAASGGTYGMMQGASSMFGGGGGFSSLFNTSSPSSGIGGMFGNNGFSNLVAPQNASYSPINTNIGMGGYQAPANFGGGTIAPRFY
jgi:hypothetical protein